MVHVLTKSNFNKEVMEEEKTVVIDFYASWCGPCKMLSPIMEEFSNEHPEIKVMKVNTDEEMELSQMFNISSIPAVFAVKNGKVINNFVGFRPKKELEALIK